MGGRFPGATEGMRSRRKKMHQTGCGTGGLKHPVQTERGWGILPQQLAFVLLLLGTWEQEAVRYKAFR